MLSGSERARRSTVWRALALLAVVAFAFGVRFALGLRTQLDGDEATLALAGLHATRGALVLMEPNGQYLGALDAYVAAPFIAVMGSTALAIRVALGVIGGLYVLSMYWLGRVLWKREGVALLCALVAAVFPLFTVYWSIKLRGGYAEMPIFEAVALALCARVGWGTHPRMRWWALLGFVSGVALWSDVLFVVVVGVIAVALLLRGRVLSWSALSRGVALACVTGLAGLAPWMAYNVPNRLHSLRAIPHTFIGFRSGAATLLSHQLPTVVGGTSSCGHDVVPAWVSDTALALLFLALLVIRRRSLRNLFSVRFSEFEPIDVVLVLIPATVAYIVVSRLDAFPCEPRHLMPLAVPLAIGLVIVLTVRWPWRAISVAGTAAWLAISSIAATQPMTDMFSFVPGAQIPFDLGPGIAMIRAQHPKAIWAQYWLSRPLSYLSGDTLPIGAYGGYVGFPRRQQLVETAVAPSWVFVEGQAGIAELENTCRDRGITYAKVTGGGLVLFTRLSGTVEPPDVLPGSAGHID